MATHGHDKSAEQGAPKINVAERAGHHTGNPQEMNRRLFMQLVVYHCGQGMQPAAITEVIAERMREQGQPVVIYADVSNPRGLGVLTFSEEPNDLVGPVRATFASAPLDAITLDTRMNMIGRSYASGYEADLQFWLLDRPRQTVLNPKWPWAVWYPLRRSGAFAQLSPQEQGAILREHGEIGRAYGEQDLAHDVRLACHGLDAADNEFLIGLIGANLHPLSHVVQSMRKTKQTSQYISQMGPFFVGRVLVQHAGK